MPCSWTVLITFRVLSMSPRVLPPSSRRLLGLIDSKPMKNLSRCASRARSSRSGYSATICSAWQVQPLQRQLRQRTQELFHVLRIEPEVQTEVVVGQEEALEFAALDLLDDLAHRPQPHLLTGHADRRAEGATARAAAGDLQVGCPVVAVLIDLLQNSILQHGHARIQRRPFLVHIALLQRAAVEVTDDLRPGAIAFAHDDHIGPGLDLIRHQGDVRAAHDDRGALLLDLWPLTPWRGRSSPSWR